AEEAEHQREERGDETGGREGEEEARPGFLHEQAGGVGADPEVRGVAEGHEPGVADEQVEAGGEQRPDDHVVGQERVEAGSQGGPRDRASRGGPPPRRPPGVAGRGRPALPLRLAAGHVSGRPMRPHGRMMRTAAMRTNTEKIEKRGMNRMPNDSTWPYTRAPRNVPQNEPRPPMTTTMKASTIISVSMPGTMVLTGVTRAPPSPPRNEPITNTAVYTRSTLPPTAPRLPPAPPPAPIKPP